jgi:outer membrane protein assembly factor BamB
VKRIIAILSAVAIGITLTVPVTGAADAAPVDPTRVKWRVKVDLDYFLQDPGVGPDGTVYIPNKFGKTQAIDPVTGATRWVAPFGGGSFSISVAADGTVYVAGGGAGTPGGTDSISALRPDGTPKWMFTGAEDYLLAGPNLGPDGNIYAVTDSTGIGFFSLTPAGQLRFATGRFSDYGSAGMNIAFGPDRAYFGFDMSALQLPTFFAYDLDGELIWTASQPDDPPSPVAGPNGNVVFLAFPSGTGQSVWSFSPAGAPVYKFYEFPGNEQARPDVGIDNVAYVTRNLSTLLALNPSGSVKWRHTDDRIMLAPRVNTQNTVVFLGGNVTYGEPGFFLALTTAGEPLFEVPLPNEPGFAEYGQLVPGSRPVFSPDGATAYSVADVAGDGNVPYADTYAFLYAIDTSASTSGLLAPTDLAGRRVSPTRIALTWRDNSSNEAGFSIERCKGAGCTSFVEIARAKANSDSATDRTVPSGGTYSYRVRAYNATGVSPYSNTVTVRK